MDVLNQQHNWGVVLPVVRALQVESHCFKETFKGNFHDG